MAKIIVSIDRDPTEEKRAGLIKRVADALGVLEEDVVLIPAGLGVSVVEVPAELVKAREKKDANDKHEAEKAAKEEEAAAKAAEHHAKHTHAKSKE